MRDGAEEVWDNKIAETFLEKSLESIKEMLIDVSRFGTHERREKNFLSDRKWRLRESERFWHCLSFLLKVLKKVGRKSGKWSQQSLVA